MSYGIGALRGIALASVLAAATAAQADTAIFINEFHYDDSSSPDAGEAIEVAGPAGTDLTGWSIVLYNGSGGAPYATLTLSGTIPTQCGAYGTVNVPAVGLQNGSPDGFALVNGTSVVQFLSYEGTFQAAGGPAGGMTSVDIGRSESNSTAPGTSLQLTGTGSEYGDFAWQPSATASFGNCNVGQSFGPPVDHPPRVASTSPVPNASGVAVTANIDITFSEAVTLGATWYDIQCNLSGAHAASVSNTGLTYQLDPTVDFASGETCTVTVRRDQVTDTDPPADPMVADHVLTFSTLGDLPPTVASSAPANNASAFPLAGNLQITFSEAVTLDDGWYTLSCATSGTHTAVQTGSGAGYTLNPATDFTPLEQCTWTILADHVHDTDGVAHAMAADRVVTFTTAGDTSNYYAGVDTSSGPALKAWLHNRIKNHVAFPYSDDVNPDTWNVLEAADQDPGDTSKVLDVYKNESYAKVGAGNSNYNREHTWPNSLGFPNASVNSAVNPPYTDCHMLYISHIGYNADRGNSPYGNCASCTERPTTLNHGVGGGSGAYPGNSNWFNANTFETWNHRRGDVARAVLYMAVRYEGGMNAANVMEPDLELTDTRSQIVQTNAQPTGAVAYMGFKSVLLDWNDQDPPDAREQLRNDVVYSYQTNRNPFIDHPEWARCVFNNTGCPVQQDGIFADGFDP
ncbi:endonuclease [Tahibacter amnicola]|uniref:Endonuclease n=1 Tax=Tahibacter amnicola TaxID=2976241 RepID=A0ABY6BKP5_9GAMM|nr:endonuclease [Tahibacter amnicola]UXI69161.1 endonuclease [Tahibacter amnicola]